MKVELRYAPLPWIGAIACHYWFVLTDASGRHRWEVWQTKNAGGICFGHVHRDLKAPEDGVGGGPSRVAAQWSGEPAGRIHCTWDPTRPPETLHYAADGILYGRRQPGRVKPGNCCLIVAAPYRGTL